MPAPRAEDRKKSRRFMDDSRGGILKTTKVVDELLTSKEEKKFDRETARRYDRSRLISWI
jgi:hypothetical protein